MSAKSSAAPARGREPGSEISGWAAFAAAAFGRREAPIAASDRFTNLRLSMGISS